jgi:hypothetical protein
LLGARAKLNGISGKDGELYWSAGVLKKAKAQISA